MELMLSMRQASSLESAERMIQIRNQNPKGIVQPNYSIDVCSIDG